MSTDYFVFRFISSFTPGINGWEGREMCDGIWICAPCPNYAFLSPIASALGDQRHSPSLCPRSSLYSPSWIPVAHTSVVPLTIGPGVYRFQAIHEDEALQIALSESLHMHNYRLAQEEADLATAIRLSLLEDSHIPGDHRPAETKCGSILPRLGIAR